MIDPVPVVSSIVDNFKKDLEDYLLTQGYKMIIRRCEEGCEIIQYFKGVAYDSCIIGTLGSNISLLMADIGYITFERLSVAIQDGLTRNKPLHDKILELFDRYGIEAESFSQNPNDPAYELKRI